MAVSGPNFDDSKAYAERVREELEATPALRDVRYGQALGYPAVSVRIDREKAGLSGVTAEQIARSLATATSSSRFIAPNYWPDPKTGIGYLMNRARDWGQTDIIVVGIIIYAVLGLVSDAVVRAVEAKVLSYRRSLGS